MRFSITIAAAGLLFAGSASAAAIDYVTTDANVFYGGITNDYDSISGLTQHPGGAHQSQTFTSDPTTSILGLTSAFTQTVASSTDVQNGVTSNATSFASANLASGILGILATGYCTPPNPNCGGEANATAEYRDSLTFHNTTGQSQDIDISFAFDGTVTGTNRQAVSATLCFTNDAFCEGAQEFQYNVGTIFGPAAPTSSAPTPYFVSASVVQGANDDTATFEGVWAVPVGTSTDFMSAEMEADCGQDGTLCDFSHTGALSISSPTGVSYTSASGVLLTQTTPEPATWWLMGAAMLVIGKWRPGRKGEK